LLAIKDSVRFQEINGSLVIFRLGAFSLGNEPIGIDDMNATFARPYVAA